MSDEKGDAFITTQWGSRVRTFANYSESERTRLLDANRKLLERISAATGIKLYLSYGCLLGAVRDGRLIGHDFDFDVVFVTEIGKVHEATRAIMDYLIQRGARVKVQTNGQFKASGTEDGHTFKLEFFAGWDQDGHFFQYFAIGGAIRTEAVLPLGTVTLEGVEFPAPRDPEAVLEAIYGATWRIPDPNFRYKLDGKKWEPFRFLFTGQNRDFWDEYYRKAADQAVFVEEPSSFATAVLPRLRAGRRLIDIGCGNGRDGLFFAKNGHKVTLCDYSEEAIAHVLRAGGHRSLEINAHVLNVTNILDVITFEKDYAGGFDAVYARFFVHAIPDAGRANFFRLAYAILAAGGEFFIEYRARPVGTSQRDYEAVMNYENGRHFRQLLTSQEVEDELRGLGFSIEESICRTGLAIYKAEDPLIGRIVARK